MDCTQEFVIDQLIAQQKPLAAFRPIGASHYFLLGQARTQLQAVLSLQELSNCRGFVLVPFQIDWQTPVWLLTTDDAPQTITLPNAPAPEEQESSQKSNKLSEHYSAVFDLFMRHLQEGQFSKLVLSRSEQVSLPHPKRTSWTLRFEQLCQLHPTAYTYICYTPQTGIWMGASPEVLLTGNTNLWHTTALAGTQLLCDRILREDWSAKNQEEQAYVADYIRANLLSLGCQVEEQKVQTLKVGSLAHLKSDFHFTLPSGISIGCLLDTLHPTPAVCGVPKALAKDFILRHEGYRRSYYSGFLGQISPEHTELYVNLRCMQADPQADFATLYAGGGIVLSSDKEDEWIETERKMSVMRALLEFR